MALIRSKYIFRVFFVVWIILWINFILRDLFVRGGFNDYRILVSRDADGKRSFVYGDYLFEFLSFCKNTLPKTTDYDFVGIDSLSLEGRRAIYFLYPHLKNEKSDFLLIFNNPDYKKKDYSVYKMLDGRSFILKRS